MILSKLFLVSVTKKLDHLNVSGNGLGENGYADILEKVKFYKNLRSHCDGVYISLYSASAVVHIDAAAGMGAGLKIKARKTGRLKTQTQTRVQTTGAAGITMKVKPRLTGQAVGKAHGTAAYHKIEGTMAVKKEA